MDSRAHIPSNGAGEEGGVATLSVASCYRKMNKLLPRARPVARLPLYLPTYLPACLPACLSSYYAGKTKICSIALINNNIYIKTANSLIRNGKMKINKKY